MTEQANLHFGDPSSPQQVISTIRSLIYTPIVRMETDFTPHLQEAIRRLKETRDLLDPIVEVPTPDGTPSCSDLFGFHPPVIDNRNTPWTSGDPLGMRKFIDSLSTQMALLQSVRLPYIECTGTDASLSTRQSHQRKIRYRMFLGITLSSNSS